MKLKRREPAGEGIRLQNGNRPVRVRGGAPFYMFLILVALLCSLLAFVFPEIGIKILKVFVYSSVVN
jgi:hypothetical protein